MPTNQQIFYNEDFNLVIRDRQKILYEGKALALTTRNEAGLLDILPEHIHFVSLIKEFIELIKPDGTTQKFTIDTGIIKVYENDVHVYLGIFTSGTKK